MKETWKTAIERIHCPLALISMQKELKKKKKKSVHAMILTCTIVKKMVICSDM